MTKSTRLLITAAAVAGLYSGSLATRAFAADQKAGQPAPKDDKAKAGCGAHGCKGQNGCAGKGGCKTSDKGCSGKNSCAGKGGCAVADAKKDDKKADAKKG
ncbi:MAG TPA: hypothetical protein VHD62_11480 [Opitutaceae bacterium]|nr:hypothetical protein [Opitutaceae bacterium]